VACSSFANCDLDGGRLLAIVKERLEAIFVTGDRTPNPPQWRLINLMLYMGYLSHSFINIHLFLSFLFGEEIHIHKKDTIVERSSSTQ
jgi:hypothetical protein